MDATTAGRVFRGQILLLRGRAGLTQRMMATLLGVSAHAIQNWEAGRGYPSAARLKALIALYLQRAVFTPGREVEEATALWELLRRETAQRTPPFDDAWFASLRPAPPVAPAGPPLVPDGASTDVPEHSQWQDWGEAPDVAAFQGREVEMGTLRRWLGAERCRLVAVLGLGGIGKTALATRLAREAAPTFAAVCWRSLRNAPAPEEWLGAAIAALAPSPPALPAGLPARLGLLLEVLRERRGLLVLDNLETVLEPGAAQVRYRAGYEGYGEVLRQLGESSHQGSLLLTAREAPPELAVLAGTAPVRTLRLEALDVAASRALLQDKELLGDDTAWQELIGRYGGNPLALKVVGQTIAELFGREIQAFLAYAPETSGAVFGGLRRLLEEQVARLSPLEQSALDWLVVEREPVGVAVLGADLAPGASPGEALEAVEALRQRSLLERGAGGTVTLQPVVLEHATARLVARVCEEVLRGEAELLIRQPLLKAASKDYVRRCQERLIAQPLLERLGGNLGSADAVEQRLLALLEQWRGRPRVEQGYGPGNVVNLLRLLRGNLRGLDLSRLAIRQAYLQGVEVQDSSLAGAHLSETTLSAAFTFPTTAALSADGARVAAGTATGEVCLWQTADRTQLLVAQGHAGPVYGVALNGDGTLVASGSEDGTVKLWDAASGRLQATLEGHTGGVYGVALSGDGHVVASAGLDGTVKLWDASGGRTLATLQGHIGPVYGVALSGDRQLVASSGEDGTVRLWEAPPASGSPGRLLATLKGHSSGVPAVALSGDGRLMASGGYDGTIKLWDAASGRLLVALEGHSGGIYSVTLSADGGLLASGSFDGTIKLWEVPSGRLLATLQGHSSGIYDVSLSADAQLMASASQDGTVKLWHAPSRQLVGTLQGHTGVILDVALSEDGRVVADCSQDGTVKLWDAASGHPLATLAGHSGPVYGVTLSADGGLLASSGFDGRIKLWEVASGRLLNTLQGRSSAVQGVALSGDGALLVSGSEDGTLGLWTAPGGQALATMPGHSGMVYGVALSGNGRLAASGGQDGIARLWEVAPASGSPGRPLATLDGHASAVMGVALSADGLRVASASLDGTLKLWDATSGQVLATLHGHAGGVADVALGGNGELVASASFDGTAKLWDAGSGRLLATLQGHTGLVHAVALSGDGRLVASGSFDGTVRLWDTRSGACLHTLRADRRCERLDITGLTGVTAAQRATLLALGAVDHAAMPEALGAVDHAAMSAGQPAPLLAPARPPTNLPPARSSFVGRTTDVASLKQALDPATGTGMRLLTLTGVAGSGKTRLALAVAEALCGSYEEGVWLVELAPVPAGPSSDPTAVGGAILSALGLQEQPGRAPLETLIDHLQPRRVLLVLDNCEHLVAACAALAARLLGACPQMQILTTSQQALGLANETVWRVAPLALPPQPTELPTPDEVQTLGQVEAVALFVQRAQAVQSSFALSAQNATAVVTICRQLDGLPLAIELAAARLHVLPVAELLARLDDRFRLLRQGGRAAVDRHQTLQATLDWSYGLLEPAEQMLLRRLAVFAGGWEVAAAEAVCAGEGVTAEAVLELLDELLERSLVYVHDVEGTPRYGLLETVRQYGLQQLERAAEATPVRDRHLAWCVTLAEQAEPALLGAEQATWLAWLEREQDNLRAALQWALDRGHSALGLRLAAGLWQYWRSRGQYGEGRRWLAAALSQAADEEEDATSRSVRASALEGAAWLAEIEHAFAQAAALFAQSATLRRALGQDEHLAAGLITAGMEARAGGDYARATALLEQSLAQQRAGGNREGLMQGGLGASLSQLALVLREQGAHARARALYEECLALHRELGEREGQGRALLGLGDIARDQGDAAQVRAYGAESLTLFGELSPRWAGFALNNLAQAAYLDGDLTHAAERAEKSAAIFRDLHAGPSLAEVLVTLGRVRGALGEAEAAQAHLTEAVGLAWAEGPRYVVALALEELAIQAVGRGQAQHGMRLLGAAAQLRQAMGTPIRPVDRPAIEEAQAVARASLGDRLFDDVWAGGQTWPMEQSVAQAMAGPEDGSGLRP
jgi:WD40 repeat protein/predicted ATPase/transcriptional regulator with XRE-family HTH domain